MDVLKALLRSRKVWIALISLVSAVIVALGGEALPEQELIQVITVVAGVLIGGIALEDAAQKRAGNS